MPFSVDDLEILMQEQKIWNIDDFAKVVRHYNTKFYSVDAFERSILDSIIDGKLLPVERESYCIESSKISLWPYDLLIWAKSKKLKFPVWMNSLYENHKASLKLSITKRLTYNSIVSVLEKTLLLTRNPEWKQSFIANLLAKLPKPINDEEYFLVHIAILNSMLTTCYAETSESFAIFTNQAEVIDYLVETYHTEFEFSKSTLQKKLAAANAFFENIFSDLQKPSQKVKLSKQSLSQEN